MNAPEPWTPDEERRLRDALRSAADEIMPGPDGLAKIRRRTVRVPFWRRPLVLGVVGATAAVTAAAVIGANLLTGPGDTTVMPASTSTATPEPSEATPPATDPGTPPPTTPLPTSPEQTPPPAEVVTVTVPVYYVVDTSAGLRLAREFRALESSTGATASAVGALFSVAPLDPDYRTLWAPTTQVRSVRAVDDALEVDLDIPAEPLSGPAELAVQQLVFTATAAAASSGEFDAGLPVRILVDGEPAGARIGGLDLSEPVSRDDQLSVRLVVQINNPADGSTVDAPVRVDGEAAVFEATLVWEVRANGSVVESGTANAAECCRFASFSFDVDLAPGTYEIEVSETDPSGGAEGRPPMSDTKTFTVE